MEKDEFADDRERWIAETKELWERNAAIPIGSFCTMEGATIDIDYGQAQPVYMKQYKLPHEEMQVVRQWRDEMLKYQIIEEAKKGCQWNSPINVQDKKDPTGRKGIEFRVCLDARRVNDLLVNTTKGEIPFIGEMHEHASGKAVHTSWDYWKCYHQFRLSQRAKECTAFTVDGVQYWFNTAPMGVTPFSFEVQQIIQKMISSLPTAKNYLDDVLSSDYTVKEHRENCTAFLKLCNENNLRLRFEKCHFFQTRILAVGRIVSKYAVEPDPRHLDMIRNWPRPTTGSQVAAVLGFAGFVRKHIPTYAQITAPLEKLKKYRKGSVESKWTNKEEQAFTGLVEAMSNAIKLWQPDWNKQFYLATDASKVGAGAMLYQKGKEDSGKIRIIGFWSKAWSVAQSNYSAPEREFLGARQAMDYFRTYLYGKKFTLVTDARAILYVHSKEEPSPMIRRYMVAMAEYSFTVVHLPGVKNIIPDTLSRRFSVPQEDLQLQAVTRSQYRGQSGEVGEVRESGEELNAANQHAENAFEIAELEGMQATQEDESEKGESEALPKKQRKKVSWADEELKGEITVPLGIGVEVDDPASRIMNDGGNEEERQRIVQEEHLSGHSGREGMFQSLVDKGYYWESMREDCRACARSCRQCLRFNVERDGFHPLTSIRAKLPMDHVAMDHYTMNSMSEGYAAVLLMVDVCTGFVFLRPVKDYTAGSAMQACMDVFTLFGFPKVIQSDNGPAFVAEMIKEFFARIGVDQRTVSAYHPRANGVAEIRVKSARNMMLKVVEGASTDWATTLPIVNYWMNQRVQQKTGSSPFAYMFARRVNGFRDFMEEEDGKVLDEQELMARYQTIKEVIFPALASRKGKKQDEVEARFNSRKRIIDAEYYPPGALVMVKDPHRKHKNEPLYTGPYSVLRRTKGKSYVLLDHGKDELFPRDVPPQQLKLVHDTGAVDEEKHYEVEAIVNHRGRKGAYEYLVHWKGYGRREDTWEAAKQFDSPALIEQYWKRRKGSKTDGVEGSPILEGICSGSTEEGKLGIGKSRRITRRKRGRIRYADLLIMDGQDRNSS
jgi:hypothetical protein